MCAAPILKKQSPSVSLGSFMNDRTRVALLSCVLALACSSPDSSLFSPVNDQTSGTGGSGASAGSSLGSSGSGAVGTGGSGMLAGEGSGAASGSGAGPNSGGTAQQGDGGEPAMGMGGVADGMGGEPSEPSEPVCGNGKREGSEECDDMGAEGQDGCNADCQVVCGHFGEDAVESDDHHCYQGYDEADFESAQADCVQRGAHLVTIGSAAENEIVASFVASSKFIGAFEPIDEMDDSEGVYEWVTGEPFDYDNWQGDEPDRNASRCSGYSGAYCYSHCAAIDDDGNWNDQRCDLEDGYVCEWEPAGG